MFSYSSVYRHLGGSRHVTQPLCGKHSHCEEGHTDTSLSPLFWCSLGQPQKWNGWVWAGCFVKDPFLLSKWAYYTCLLKTTNHSSCRKVRTDHFSRLHGLWAQDHRFSLCPQHRHCCLLLMFGRGDLLGGSWVDKKQQRRNMLVLKRTLMKWRPENLWRPWEHAKRM